MTRRFLHTLIIVIFGIFTIIGSNGRGGDDEPATGNVSITSTSEGVGLPDDGTLVVSVFVDGSTTAAASTTIDTTTVTVTIGVDVVAGTHSFRMVFDYTDQQFAGPFQIAISNSATVVVTEESTHSISFSSTDYTYPDFDSDGLDNVAELHSSMRTDPSNPRCVLDKSILDSCTLG